MHSKFLSRRGQQAKNFQGSALDCLASGQWEQARQHAATVLSRNEDNAKMHLVMACALVELQKIEQGEQHFLRSLSLAANDQESVLNYARFLKRQSRFSEAIKYYKLLAEIRPLSASEQNEWGHCLAEVGETLQAEALFRSALKLDPALSSARGNLLLLLEQIGQHAQAMEVIGWGEVTGFEEMCARARVYKALGRFMEAREVLEVNPPDPVDQARFCKWSCHLGGVLLDLDEHAQAKQHFDAAWQVALQSKDLDTVLNCGQFYLINGQYALAELAADWLLAESPDSALALMLKACILRDNGRYAEAMPYFEHAIERSGSPQEKARFSLYASSACLGLGKLEQGWSLYEERWVDKKTGSRSSLNWPEWQGEACRSLLLYNEQGVGDEVFFSSIFPDLAGRAGHIVCVCTPKLRPLFARSFPHICFVPVSAPPHPMVLEHFDFQLPVGSLGRLFRTTPDSFHRIPAVLQADPVRVEQFRQRMTGLPGLLKVGLAWRSGLQGGDRGKNYPSLEAMRPLLALPGVSFVNVQYGATAEELARFEQDFGVVLHDAREVDHFDDLDSHAAVLSACDLVICPCTVTSVLAPALGVPTLQVLSQPDDPWMLGQASNPWFPQLMSFGKPCDAGWDVVFEKLALVVGGLVLERTQQERPNI